MKNKEINILLDISMSMKVQSEKVIPLIDIKDCKVNLFMCDMNVTYKKLNSTDVLNEMEIPDGGGTVLQLGIDEISKKCNDYNNVIITDGSTDMLNFKDINGKTMVLILTCEEFPSNSMCPIHEDGDNGKVSQIFLDTDNINKERVKNYINLLNM